MPAWGLSNAAATMVGQSLGARDPQRAEQAVRIAGFYTMLFLGAIGLLFVLAADPLVGIFTQDAAVAGHATRCLRIVAAGFLFYAYGMVFTQAFNGAGDTLTPTILNIAVFWLFEIQFLVPLPCGLAACRSGRVLLLPRPFAMIRQFVRIHRAPPHSRTGWKA